MSHKPSYETLRSALEWIMENPSAHPANMVNVAKYALEVKYEDQNSD